MHEMDRNVSELENGDYNKLDLQTSAWGPSTVEDLKKAYKRQLQGPDPPGPDLHLHRFLRSARSGDIHLDTVPPAFSLSSQPRSWRG